jgi:hypothetical protein
MSARSGSNNRRLAESIYTRLGTVMMDAVRRVAQGCDLSPAAWVRQQIDAALKNETAQTATRPRSLRGPVADRDTLRRLGELATRLGRQTGALIQFAKATRESGIDSSLHEEIEATLDNCRKTQARVIQIIDGLTS